MSDLSNDPTVIAERNGWRVVLPAIDELQLDIDDAESESHYQSVLGLLNIYIDAVETHRTVSPGGNTHVYVKVNRELGVMERIALQACLGSDRRRELYSVLRVALALPVPPTVLFEADGDGGQP